MDELVELVSKKTGLPKETARKAAVTVIDFLKDKLPAPIASQVDGLLKGNLDAGALDSLKDLGGLFGK